MIYCFVLTIFVCQDVSSAKALIRDAVFTSPTRDETVIVLVHQSNSKV